MKTFPSNCTVSFLDLNRPGTAPSVLVTSFLQKQAWQGHLGIFKKIHTALTSEVFFIHFFSVCNGPACLCSLSICVSVLAKIRHCLLLVWNTALLIRRHLPTVYPWCICAIASLWRLCLSHQGTEIYSDMTSVESSAWAVSLIPSFYYLFLSCFPLFSDTLPFYSQIWLLLFYTLPFLKASPAVNVSSINNAHFPNTNQQ